MIPLLTKKLHDKAGVFKLAILTSPLFIFGLIAKLYAAAFFAGVNFTTLFVPFAKYYAQSRFADPYAHFYTLNITEIFPYPQLMLFIFSLPGILWRPLLSPGIFSISHLELFLYHLPLIAADITILLVLSRWLKNRHRELLILYWLSPVFFYINYLHGQLDVIPIACVFVFLHYLFRERWLTSFIFLAAGVATKFHLVILLPFTLVYLWQKEKRVSLSLMCVLTVSAVFLALNDGQLFSPAFRAIVFGNREQPKVFDLAINFGESVVYVIPLAYAALFLHSLTFKRINRDTFVMFLGFSFGLLTLLIAPMPGWYYWVLPFFVYFYIKNERFSKLPFYLLCAAYFIYFAVVPTSDYFTLFKYFNPSIAAIPNLYTFLTLHNLPADLVTNLSLTLLQATLLVNVVWLYRRGLEESKKRKLFNMPYLVGIAGDSGSGKSTLAELLMSIFGRENVALVAGDAMHKWERGHEMWQQFTHLNPSANALHDDLEYALSLRAGEDIYRRHYDHDTGHFTLPERLASKKLIVFEGLHSFYLTSMQRALDLKIFIQPEEQLRIHWKLVRDMQERGYTRDTVLAQLEKRASDASEYIAVQEQHADITVTLRAETDLSGSVGNDLPLALFLELKFDNTINIDSLLRALSEHIRIEHRFTDQSQVIRCFGTPDAATIEALSFALVPEVYELTVREPVWSDGHNGILELFICYYILQSLRLSHHYGNGT